MPQIQRKPRPLARNPTGKRDDRLVIIACDDTYAPKQYFDFYKITRVHVFVVPTEDGTSSAQHVLERVLAYRASAEPDDELWMVLDTDHYIQGTHIKGFMRALRDAGRAGVEVALSRPCFELWLLLHHVDEPSVTALTDANSVCEALRATLGAYDKTRLKSADFAPSRVAEASDRARRLDAKVPGGLIPKGPTTRIYRLWDAILRPATADRLSEAVQRVLG